MSDKRSGEKINRFFVEILLDEHEQFDMMGRDDSMTFGEIRQQLQLMSRRIAEMRESL